MCSDKTQLETHGRGGREDNEEKEIEIPFFHPVTIIWGARRKSPFLMLVFRIEVLLFLMEASPLYWNCESSEHRSPFVSFRDRRQPSRSWLLLFHMVGCYAQISIAVLQPGACCAQRLSSGFLSQQVCSIALPWNVAKSSRVACWESPSEGQSGRSHKKKKVRVNDSLREACWQGCSPQMEISEVSVLLTRAFLELSRGKLGQA